MSFLGRLAAHAPAPVFPAIGSGAEEAVARLCGVPGIRLTRTPREASVLLVAGVLRKDDLPALKRLHDQLPHPRGTIWWDAQPLAENPVPTRLSAEEDPASAIEDLHRALMKGEAQSETMWLPDEPPNPWKGLGDHGQGGKGMMGGTPYGRPMAMTAADLRDGLMLDSMTFTIGPFLPALPPGLALQLTMQGDVVQTARVVSPPFHRKASEPSGKLLRAARMLDLIGLDRLAARCRKAATGGQDTGDDLLRRARRAGAFLAIPPEQQDVRERLAEALGGDSAPAAGDARLVDRLPGLEWQSAMLEIASHDAASPERIAPVTPDENAEEDE